jgi:undecaprenyl-phosphate 4-deoxy-4-formamido-L-arabinose transferase
VIRFLCRNDHRLKGIQLSRNYGQHNALLCGIRAASGEIIVTIDDDLQNPPEEIPRLLAPLQQNIDVVYGTPRNPQHGVLRNVASQITKLALQNVMGAATASQVSAFRAFRTDLRQAFAGYRSPTVNIDVLLTWGTTAFTTVPVEHAPRAAGTTGYTIRKLLAHAMNMITGFSTVPLRFASILGLVFAAFGFLLLAYILLRYFWQGAAVPGFHFLSSMIAIFSGVQLFTLGIFGEYLARIHFRTMDRPPYNIATKTCDAPLTTS